MKFTKEQVKEWKAKHGELFEITVEDKSCILHPSNTQGFILCFSGERPNQDERSNAERFMD